MFKKLGMFLIIVTVVGAVMSGNNDDANQKSVSSSASQAPACSTNYKLCNSNADVANNYTGFAEAQVDCKLAADKQAKYGDPKWPGFWKGGAFGSFLGGESYKNGTIMLVEPNAQFENGFGAYEHVEVYCLYDLAQKHILSVRVIPQ